MNDAKPSVLHKRLSLSIVLTLIFFLLLLFAGMAAYFYLYLRITTYNIQVPEGKYSHDFTYGSWPALENTAFFKEVAQRFIANKTDFIEADLAAMTLRIYTQGSLAKEAKILSKGKEGSWWETPSGLYKVGSKEATHFSSFGKVYTPWNLPFQGNFFIHGWPYYPDGTPVAPHYSGGCIRLSTEDAKAVYELARKGIPVLVYEQDFTPDSFRPSLRAPEVSAGNFLVADMKSGYVFAEKGSLEAVPIASITKLMTALVATEYVNLEKEIDIPQTAIVKTSVPRLKAGGRATLFSLLHPLLMESSNEAAEAIARSLGRNYFINLMNEKAKAIGMEHSAFSDPSGSEAANVSTAEDLFLLARYLYNNRSFILKLSAGSLDVSAYEIPEYQHLANFNALDGQPEFAGGKVGLSTDAGETMLAIFETPFNGETRPVAVIALQSKNNKADITSLFEWAKTTYR